MAKSNFEKAIDKAINRVYKKYDEAMQKSVEEAIKQGKKDLKANAVSCLVLYYNDYTPTSYNRTYQLIDCIVPYSEPIVKTNDGYVCDFGVDFDENRILYNGSSEYSPADSGWIIDNFLLGLHPRTNGLSEPGLSKEFYDFQFIQGTHVPQDIMAKFIEGYKEIFYKNIHKNMSKQVLKNMKK
jgi:hypothetical protein